MFSCHQRKKHPFRVELKVQLALQTIWWNSFVTSLKSLYYLMRTSCIKLVSYLFEEMHQTIKPDLVYKRQHMDLD